MTVRENTDNMSELRQNSWWIGFGNLLRKENHEWWGTKRWIKQALLWLFISAAFPSLLMFGQALLPSLDAANGTGPVIDPIDAGINLYLIAAMTGVAIGIALFAQGQVIDEMMTGTAEWVLSKPIARSAFLLAKFTSTTFSALILMIVVPGLVMYALLSLKLGTPFPTGPYLVVVGLIVLNTLFYLALTFLLSTITISRGLVLGVVIGLVFGSQLILQLMPELTNLTPWGLMVWSRMVGSGMPLSSDILQPVGITILLTIACIGFAVAYFERTEF